MGETIAQIILFISFVGIAVIIVRKIPVLAKLPMQKPSVPEPYPNSWSEKLIRKIKNFPGLKSFSLEIFLQKILSKIRILSLKADSKTFNLLQKLREKTQKKKNLENDDYWKELKNSTNCKSREKSK